MGVSDTSRPRFKFREGELVWIQPGHPARINGPAIVLNGMWKRVPLTGGAEWEAEYEVLHGGEVWPKIYEFEIKRWKE